MPEKINIPPHSELLETIRTTQQLREKFPKKLWVVQPKFDGSKCILIPTDKGYIATTGNGNKMECMDKTLQKLNGQFSCLPLTLQPVFEAEIEPEPWTQENKVKLNGNLYNDKPLPFDIKLTAFDCIPQLDFNNQTVSGAKTNARMAALTEYSEMLGAAGIKTSETFTMTTEEVAELMDDGVKRGKAQHRVMFNDIPVEGYVIRDPEAPFLGGKRSVSAIKLKPFVSLDLYVVAAGKKDNGTAALGCIDTKDPNQPYYLFTGLPKTIQQDPASMLGKVVEIEILTTDDPKKGVGNPTYKAERPDKSFDGFVEIDLQSSIQEKLVKAGMTLVGSEIEL